ncbi:hypothetical protein P154DRAFT_55930 [Amniculicola lignicola CBS 123094]|uniref:ER transporter 6TM N-terminal domain-containing protein n=1 Tax=Amniculicola lignicola CBS 123094 TaxID=1392246 RepID=A0A6A5WU80_9PLEO|nr:hypothetical protein P154DRAFT_55930 [Amniculicola lignicola CBS 123094]
MAELVTASTESRPDGDGSATKLKNPNAHKDGNGGAGSAQGGGAKKLEGEKKKMFNLGTLWKKMDLDLVTVLMMMKAALPPAIGLAMYEANDVAKTYTTLGYLIAIIAILGFCIMPRAKFLQTMTMNVISACLGSAVAMLMTWSGVQARLNTTPAGAPPDPYNSSQSAVCGVFLFFYIWLINTVKAKFPQMAFPTIIFAIFINVAAVYGPLFQTTAQVEDFVRRLLISFLTGLGLATGVSLFIIPVTCRKVVVKGVTGYVMLLRKALQAHKSYLASLERADMFGQITPAKDNKNSKSKSTPEVEALTTLTTAFTQLHGKLAGDLPFAKREFAYGKLTPEDFEGIFKHLRGIMIPLIGLSSLVDLFDRQAELNHWDGYRDSEHPDPEVERRQEKAVEDWNHIMESVHEPFANILQVMDEGLEHVLLRFQFIKPPKKKKESKGTDPEAKGELVKPGDSGFANYLETQCDIFYQGKESTLRQWMQSKGLKVKDDLLHDPKYHPVDSVPTEGKLKPASNHPPYEKQLYTILYIVYLLHSVSKAVLEFVKFADQRDQAVAKKSFITPGRRRMKKWVANVFQQQDSNHEDEMTVAGLDKNNVIVYMGEAYKERKDPEHLPPTNMWEKFGNFMRGSSKFLRSSESSFGFRCACATMSIAIIAFLRDTQKFFIEQRIVWAMIMVAISMTPTAGTSIFTFLLRIFGTVVAMVAAFLVWYIPDQRTAGIIVFLWVFVALGFYIPLKKPSLVILGLLSCVTTTMIIGYELEVRKIGIDLATSNGQPYYPIYLLGPYRLATVVGGLAVAMLWTLFPFPITEHSALRQKLGGALYLSANFYSIVHETVLARIRGDEGDPTDPASPAALLEKSRNKVFAKEMLILQALRTHSDMVGWEFPLGGKFPRAQYDEIIKLLSNIVSYTALLGYASSTFSHPYFSDEQDPSQAQWFKDFRKIVVSANVTSHEVTSMLSLLSSSITTGQPLPPYLKSPQSYKLAERLEAVDRDILSLRHIAEPEYAAFAVVQISTRCIVMDIEKLLKAVKTLVGEMDFSFHIVSTQNSSAETLAKTPSHRSKQE